MNVWKLISRIAVACALLLATFSATGGAIAQSTQPSSLTLKQAPLTVTAGYPRNWPPQYSTDENGAAGGFAIDLMNAIAAKAGMTIKYVAFDNFPDAVAALRNKKVDLIPNVGIVPARREYALFTTPVETFNVSIFVRSTTQDIQSLEDLFGLKVGVVQENIGKRILEAYPKIDSVAFNSVHESLFELVSGTVDAVIYPEPVFLQNAQNVGIESKIKIVGKPLREIRRGIAVRTDYPGLVERLNPVVSNIIKSKQYESIYTKWYGKPQPFWTKPEFLSAAGIASIVALALVLIWRFISISALNRKLKLEMREREESERALKLSEKGLANAQRIAKLGSWKYDIKNKTSKRSEEFYRIMGQDPKQGDPLFEDNINLTHPEDRDKVKAAFDACMSTFAPYDVEHRVIRPDGEMRHVHKRGEITFDKDGNPEFLDGTMLDVTERKLAEERLSDAIESINEGFALYDSKDRLVLFNSKYRETFPEIREKIVPGVTYEELLWHSVNCGVYPEEIDRKKEFIHERVKRHQLGNDSLEIKLSNNRWILLSDRTTKGGEIVGVRTDITELKIREEALRESEARLDAFFTEAPAGLVLFDKNLRYVKINKMLAETAGISAEEHIGKSFSEVVPEIAENVTPIMMKILETGKPVINLETRNKSGKSPEETQWWNSSLFPIFGTDGTPTGIGAVSSDITAIKKAEINILNLNANLEKRVEIRTQELKEAKERAEEASSAKSSFLSNMSHELRTPMNAILGFGQLMELGSDNILSPKQKEYLDHILSSGNHLLELINEVLDLAKIESDTSSLSISEVLPMDVFRNCATQIHPIAEKYGITDINITCMGALPEIYADEIRLKQVMMNLLSNAAKYNTPGGSITCDCEKTNGGMLRFSITDTGMGIPDDRRDELFQPFNRLNAENSGIEGTGVGLTITKKLVELMGGAVGYDSVYGEGSTFWFELPLTEKGKKQEIEIVHKDFAFESETNHSGARTLLYIEDNPANLRLMEEVIEKVSDIEMISAHTAELGLEIAQTMKPDIIILDIMLPGLNGFDALKRLQNSKSVNHVPVLALSANAMKTDIEKGMEAGFFAYLTKPINIRKTVNVIREALGDEPENVVAIPIKG